MLCPRGCGTTVLSDIECDDEILIFCDKCREAQWIPRLEMILSEQKAREKRECGEE